MLITLLLTSFAIAILVKLTKGQWLKRCFLSLGVAFFLAISTGFVPQTMMGYLSVNHHFMGPRENAVIIIPGAGIDVDLEGQATPPFYAFARMTKGVEILNQCKISNVACKILISGGVTKLSHNSEAEIYSSILKSMGVPADQILLESSSKNTWQNAQMTAEMVKNNYQQYILVTNGLHAKRAALYFNHFDIDVEVANADNFPIKLNPLFWGMNWMAYDIALHEMIGIARYWAYETLGLNKN